MAYIGKNPRWNTSEFTPQSTTPANPTEGMVFRSDGTDLPEGLWEYKNAQWQEIGGGQAGINYIENNSAESGTTDWSTYADAAGESPVDGTGGSANITLTSSSSNPLRDDLSFLITKDAANRQGEGISYDFSIDRADRAKIIEITMDYEVDSSYADDDIRVFIYDVTNTVLIPVSPFELKASSLNKRFKGYFQTDDTSTSYRLIIHVASTNASAYTLKFDNVRVGPIISNESGNFVSDWEVTTNSIKGSTSNPTKGTIIEDIFMWRRVGPNMEFILNYRQSSAGGAAGSGTYYIELPSGLSVSSEVGELAVLGSGKVGNSTDTTSATTRVAHAIYSSGISTNGFIIHAKDAIGTYTSVSSSATSLAENAQYIIQGSIPIQGWASGVNPSEIGTNRNITVIAEGNAGTSLTALVTDIDFTSVEDNSSSWSGTIFTAPETAVYSVSGMIRYTANISSGNVYAYVDTVQTKDLGFMTGASPVVDFSGHIKLNKGQQLSFRTSDSGTLLNDSVSHHLHIEKVPSALSHISPSETIACSYSSDSGQTVATAANIIYEDLDFDTHSAYNSSTGDFTAPISGKYLITASMRGNVSTSHGIGIFLNGTTTLARCTNNNGSDSSGVYVTYVANLIKGDVISIINTLGASRTLTTTSTDNIISIVKIG